MSKSIDNLLKQLLDSQESQAKALEEKFAAFAGENNTYTERMRKMEESLSDAMKKVLEMDNNIKDYHKATGSKVEAMEAQYAKMFAPKTDDEGAKEDEKKHEENEPESIKKQEEEMEDDEKKKAKKKAKKATEDEEENEAEEKEPKALEDSKINDNRGKALEDSGIDDNRGKAGKFPVENKLIVDGPDAEAANDLGGINKNQTVLTKPNQKRHKENPMGKPKNAEETIPETQASEEQSTEAQASETEAAPVASAETPASVSAAVAEVVDDSIDAKIEAIAKKFASLAAIKPVALAEELNSTKATMAMEVAAKEEAVSKYKALEEKFETLMSKVNSIEKSAKTVEEKAAQIVSNHGTEAVAISVDTAPVAETDSDIYKKFEALSGVEQRKFYLANKQVIERHASSVLRSKRS
jgi:hypothetical protein